MPPIGTSTRRLIQITFLLALAVNFAWEMTQMYFYSSLPDSIPKMLFQCGFATVGDGLYTVLLYLAGAALTGDRRWIVALQWSKAALVVAAGFVSGVVLERIALAFGLWRYSAAMPTILGAGMWPVVQAMLLPVFVFRLATWFGRESLKHRGESRETY